MVLKRPLTCGLGCDFQQFRQDAVSAILPCQCVEVMLFFRGCSLLTVVEEAQKFVLASW